MARMYVTRKSINPVPCTAVSRELTSTIWLSTLPYTYEGIPRAAAIVGFILGIPAGPSAKTFSSSAAVQKYTVSTYFARPRAIGSNRIISAGGQVWTRLLYRRKSWGLLWKRNEKASPRIFVSIYPEKKESRYSEILQTNILL